MWIASNPAFRRGRRALVVAAVVLAACGDATVTTTTTPVAAPSTTATPAQLPDPTTTVPVTAAATTSTTRPPPSTTTTSTTIPAPRVVVPGAAALAARGFDLLAGKRVGLIANHTSAVGDARLIDLLASHPDVELAGIFAPEHGVTGTADAGELVEDGTDPLAGIPVHSLYGTTRKPTPAMLAGVDVLVFDLQDVGTRFYTYISTMGLAMQSAAEAGVPFVVLDRPNPIGGDAVSGFTLEPSQQSFIGQYPIPSAYGLTTGELARAIVGERWLPGLDGLDLTVVPIEGWRRTDRWPDTGLPWVPPSPGLPAFSSAAAYPGTVLFEATSISYGRGTYDVFAVVGAPWADGDALVFDLTARNLAGVRFEAVAFTPEVLDIAPTPQLEGVPLEGVRVVVTDPIAFDPVATGVHLLEVFQRQADAVGAGSLIDRPETFDLLAGTPELRRMLDARTPAADIVAAWAADVAAFASLREPYLLYGS